MAALIERLSGVVVLTFVLYCIIAGIQELKQTSFTNARFFDIFGLFFEILVFTATVFIIRLLTTRGIWDLENRIVVDF